LAQKTLVFGANGEPVSLEPGNITDGISIYVQRQIYDTLVDFKPGSTEVTAGLAASWFSSADGKVWTFRLRQGIRFQDGTELTAEAVKFNVERWWDPKNPTRIDAAARYEIWPELFGGFKGDPGSLLKEVQVVDKYTVRFVLTQPFPAFPAAIGSGYFGIASPSAIRKDGAKYGSPTGSAVGTGPLPPGGVAPRGASGPGKEPHLLEAGLPQGGPGGLPGHQGPRRPPGGPEGRYH